MKKRRLYTKILIYFFSLLLTVFLVLAVIFNLSIKMTAKKEIRHQIEESRKKALDVLKDENTPASRAVIEKYIRDDSSEVRVLFLDEEGNYIPPDPSYREIYKKQAEKRALESGAKVSTGIGNRLGKAGEGRTSRQIATAIKEQNINLSDEDAKEIKIADHSYLIQSIPYRSDKLNYLVAYVNLESYDSFLKTILNHLLMIITPILVISFLVIKFLAKQITDPIEKLNAFSKRIGEGDFRSEDLNIKDKELSDLNSSLNETADKLKKYHENQRVLFQNASHELRTPLTSIKGYAEGIKYGVFSTEEATDVILKESSNLEKLVDDILYLSRLESDESVLEEKSRVKFSDLLYEARERVLNKATINEKVINVISDSDFEISVYYEDILRAVTNILINAIRYAKSQISVHGYESKEFIIIDIKDDGNGIDKNIINSIFDRFRRGEMGEHGIGLSIAKAAVLRHKGDIEVKNTESGALFIVKIPKTEVMGE